MDSQLKLTMNKRLRAQLYDGISERILGAVL